MGWIGPAIGGVASLGGAALGSKGANKAAEAQSKAASEALAFQKAEAAKKWEFDQKRWDAWNAGRAELMKRYGIDIAPPSMAGGEPPAGPGGAVPRQNAPRQAGAPANLAGLMQGQTPEDMGDWANWERYGLGGQRGA